MIRALLTQSVPPSHRPTVPLRRASLLIPLICFGLSGCAYYNGMYNAKRWAKQAERSERLGRTAEARDRWARAAVHAESLLSRHPRSKWVDDALLIRGRALLAGSRSSDAVVALEQAARVTTSEELRDEAHLLLGQANIAVRRLPEAESTLVLATAARSAAVRDRAWWHLGRALLAQGRPRDALGALDSTLQPEAPLDRLRAGLALADRAVLENAAAELGSAPYREVGWGLVLDSLYAAGHSDLMATLVRVLVQRTDLTSGERARLLLTAARRLLATGNRSEAETLLVAARAAAPDSSEARSAEVHLIGLRAWRATAEAELAEIRPELQAIVALGGAAGFEALPLLRLFDRLDALGGEVPFPDAAWYLRSEIVRDSLRAPGVAARLFAAMGERFPESPWTPKGLIAAISGGHPAGDSLGEVLLGTYRSSPYVAATAGAEVGAAGFAQLEDSLAQTLAALTGAGPGRPGAPAGQDRLQRPGARPPAGRARTPDP